MKACSFWLSSERVTFCPVLKICTVSEALISVGVSTLVHYQKKLHVLSLCCLPRVTHARSVCTALKAVSTAIECQLVYLPCSAIHGQLVIRPQC